MRCVDVNILVNAFRDDAPDHQAYREWLDASRRAPEPLGVPALVVSGFLRVVTHPKVFIRPTPLDEALAFADAVRASPNHVAVHPGPRHWAVFTDLCHRADARGNAVPDAYLAAMAIELGATWFTADRGFARYPGLRWRHPLEGNGR